MSSKSRWMMGADFHLGGCIRSSASTMKEDFGKALTCLKEKLIETSVNYLTIGGDLFNTSRINGKIIESWREFVEFCSDNNIYILYIPGNHEITSEVEGTALPSAVNPFAKNISDGVYEIEGYKIQGFPECDPDTAREYLYKASECDLLVMHAPFKHLLNIGNPIDVSDVPSKVKNVLTGHIHRPDKKKLPNSEGYVFSPGSLHALALDEMEFNGGVWVTDDPSDGEQWEWHKVFEQPLRTYIVRDEISLEDTKQQISEIEPAEECSAPTTINLKYYPEIKKETLSFIRSNDRPDIRFINSMISEDAENNIEIDESWKDENLFDSQAVERAFLEETENKSKELKNFLQPFIHQDSKEARESLRNWLHELGVNDLSI